MRRSCARHCSFPDALAMRIGKPLLLITTTLGLGLGIYEAFRLAPRVAWLLVLALALFGAGIAWISHQGQRGKTSRPGTGLEAGQAFRTGRSDDSVLAGLHA